MDQLFGLDTCIFILGTRPEIIKLSPVIRACAVRGLPYHTIHTGQHTAANMDRVFFDDLDVPGPDERLNAGTDETGHGRQTGRMLEGIERILIGQRPDIVLVQGDTNTALAGALAATKLNIPVGHVEAGLRSYDRSMPEEINRVVIDHTADLLFCPTEGAAANLRREGLPDDRIMVTGNTIVDVIRSVEERPGRDVDVPDGDYALLTLHRQENVDSRERFGAIMDAVRELPLPVIFPVHPRARKQGDAFGILTNLPSGIQLVEPIGYSDFLRLQKRARVVLTDSGGVQEEACVLGVPCVTLRENTERPETVETGANRLAGWHRDGIIAAVTEALAHERTTVGPNPFGDGNAAGRILDAVARFTGTA